MCPGGMKVLKGKLNPHKKRILFSGESEWLVVVIGLVPWDDYPVAQLETSRDSCSRSAATINYCLADVNSKGIKKPKAP